MSGGDKSGDVSMESMFKTQVGGGEVSGEKSSTIDQNENEGCESAINGNLKTKVMKPRITEKHDLTLFLQGNKSNVFKNLKTELEEKKGLKWFISVQVKMVKYRPDGADQFAEPHFRSTCQRLVNLNELEEQFQECMEKITESFQTYQKEGSGWQLKKVIKLDLSTATTTPLYTTTRIKLH